MNYLAHLFLSFEDPDILTGNFLADMISNKIVKTYPEGIRRGVFVHRKIDTFTDDHPDVLKGVRRLYGRHSKYASVLIDIYYDYLLAKNWDKYADKSLQDFADNTYKVLRSNMDCMSERIQRQLIGMSDANWLVSYGSLDGIAFAIGKLKNRVSKPELLEGAIDSLIEDMDLLDEEFNRFFPEIMEFIRGEIG
jgi:acyl carrier protein phosphodiesterase